MQNSTARRWAFDQEVDSPLIPFDDAETGLAHVVRQNVHQGRERWLLLSSRTEIPDRGDGTPAILPNGSTISIGGRLDVSCAQALEIAGALAHAADGTRRIVGRLTATPVADKVELVIVVNRDMEHVWWFPRESSRALAVRVARLATHCITASKDTTK